MRRRRAEAARRRGAAGREPAEKGPSHEAPPVTDFLDRTRFPVDPWRLVEPHFSDEDLGTTETLFAVGNGYLGMRGNVEEGRDSHAHGTFINGFHETWPIQHAEEAFGFARVGQTIVNAPDAKVIRLYVDDEPLLLPVADLLEYERVLDFRTGVLSPRRSCGGRPAASACRSAHAPAWCRSPQRHLAVMTFEVTLLDDSAPVAISSQILNRQDGEDEYHVPAKAMGEGVDPRKAERFNRRVLEPVLQQRRQGRAAGSTLGYRCADSGMTLARRRRPPARDRQRLHRATSTSTTTSPRWSTGSTPSRASRSRSPSSSATTPPAACRRASCSTAAAAPSTGRAARASSAQFARPARAGSTTSGSARDVEVDGPATRSSRRCAGTSSSSPRRRRAPRAAASRPRASPARATAATTSGTPRSTCSRS